MVSGEVTVPPEEQDPSLQMTSLVVRKFQTDWLKFPLLQEVEAAIRLGFKPQCGDLVQQN